MTVRTGNLLYTSGHLPISLEGEMMTGKVRFLQQKRSAVFEKNTAPANTSQKDHVI